MLSNAWMIRTVATFRNLSFPKPAITLQQHARTQTKTNGTLASRHTSGGCCHYSLVLKLSMDTPERKGRTRNGSIQ